MISPQEAVKQLVEVSTEITSVVLLEGETVLASTYGSDRERSEAVAATIRRLDEAATSSAGRLGRGTVTQLQAALPEGSVFIVRDGTHTVAATTGPKPTVGLIFYDLKSCLRDLRETDDDDADGDTTRNAATVASAPLPSTDGGAADPASAPVEATEPLTAPEKQNPEE